MITPIITNIYYAIIMVIILTIIIYLLLKYIENKYDKIWNFSELFWLIIAFFGLFAIIDQNKKQYNLYENEYLNFWIERDYKELFNHLDSTRNCRQYIHNEKIFTKIEFDSMQQIENKRCEWSQMYLDSIFKIYNSYNKTINYKSSFSYPDEYYNDNRIDELILNINQNIKKKEVVEEELIDNFWDQYSKSYGLLFLYLAFAIRFAITFNKIKN